MRIDNLVSRAAFIVSIGCVAVVGVTMAALANPSVRAGLGFRSEAAVSYTAGEHIALPVSIYGASPLTLVVFASSDCSVCQKAAPGIRSLAGRISTLPGVMVTVVIDVAREQVRGASRRYVDALGLQPDRLIDLDLAKAGIKRVPTLVLVDQRGTVRSEWDSPFAGDEVLRGIASASSDR